MPRTYVVARTSGLWRPRASTKMDVGALCPDGLVCSPATQTCELHAIDARLADSDITVDSPRPVDARPDSVPPDALVLPALLQQKQASAAAGPSLSLTLDSAPANGDVLVMIGGCPAAPLMTATGGGVTNWMRAASSTVNVNVELWFGVTDGWFSALNGVTGHGTGVSQGGWYRDVVATGTYSASVTETSHHWDAVLVSLRVAP